MSILDPISLTVTRRPGGWVDGVWTPDTDECTTITIIASRPQPVGPELIEMLPEGARTSARYVIYVEDDQPALYLVENAEHAADRVAYKGAAYLVTSAEDWTLMPLGHDAYVLLEVTGE